MRTQKIAILIILANSTIIDSYYGVITEILEFSLINL